MGFRFGSDVAIVIIATKHIPEAISVPVSSINCQFTSEAAPPTKTSFASIVAFVVL